MAVRMYVHILMGDTHHKSSDSSATDVDCNQLSFQVSEHKHKLFTSQKQLERGIMTTSLNGSLLIKLNLGMAFVIVETSV